MKATNLFLAVLFAAACVIFSCTSHSPAPTFEEVYPQVLKIVDNPNLADSSAFEGNGISKLYDAAWEEDSMPMRLIVYGNGMKVSGNKAGYTYAPATEGAFAIRISMFMDPVVSFDFKTQVAAEEFYKGMLEYGLVEDKFNCVFVTDTKQKPGITKVNDLSKYGRTICVSKPAKTSNGWYSITMGN